MDAVKGNLTYFDGESWKPIPNGSTGDILTMGDDGFPAWSGQDWTEKCVGTLVFRKLAILQKILLLLQLKKQEIIL